MLHLQTNPDDNRIYKTRDRFYYTQMETLSVIRIRPIYLHLFKSHVYTDPKYTYVKGTVVKSHLFHNIL